MFKGTYRQQSARITFSDTAFNYNNEEAIGRALKKWFESGKGCREEIFITTKVHLHV